MKALLSVLTFVSTLTLAQAQNFLATLDGLQDGGGGRTGSGTINLTLSGTTITFSGSFSGLSGNVNSGGFHIHAPASPGQGANVLYGLFPSITLGGDQRSGTISGSQVLVAGQLGFDIPTQLSQLSSGLWYFNIHTASFGAGEIRGQINPVPEPATWALGGLGFLGLLVWKRRK